MRGNMKNIIKIVILGIVGFGILVYLTAPKNINKKFIGCIKEFT